MWEQLLQEARNPQTPPERLRELMLQRGLSYSEQTTLSQAVVLNPNTPLKELFCLGRRFPDLFWRNPVIPLLLLENPGFLAEIPFYTMRPLLRARNVPPLVWEAAARHKEYQVCQAVASNPRTPPALLQELARHPYSIVRWEIAQNPSAPPSVLAELAQQKDAILLRRIARNPSTPLPILLRFLHELENPPKKRPGVFFVRLLEVAEHPALPLPYLRKLACSHDPAIRTGVARNRSAPLELLERLANDREPMVRRAIALREGIPARLQAQLIAELWHIPISYSGQRRFAALSGLPAAILELLSRSRCHRVRVLVAKHPNTAPETLERLARDRRFEVREAVARSPSTPADLLQRLAKDANRALRRAVAKNRATPRHTLRNLARTDPSPAVRREAYGTLLWVEGEEATVGKII